MVQATGKGPGWKAEARGGKYIPAAARSYVLGRAAGQKKYVLVRAERQKTYQNTAEAVKTAAAYFL